MRITRTEYLNKLIAFKDKQLIKVVTGIRRCGKSVLMEMYQDWLLQNGVEQDQIIAINFEDLPPFRCHLVRRSRHQRFPPQLARS